jgi:hypothetical protein
MTFCHADKLTDTSESVGAHPTDQNIYYYLINIKTCCQHDDTGSVSAQPADQNSS